MSEYMVVWKFILKYIFRETITFLRGQWVDYMLQDECIMQ